MRQRFAYIARTERGVQFPLQALHIGTGTCRDFAVFLIKALRSLDLAARLVSGYLYVPERGGASAAVRRMLGCASISQAPAGWSWIRPMASSAPGPDPGGHCPQPPPCPAPCMGPGLASPSDELGMTVDVSVTTDPAVA
ncbi:MAG TPA: transglutaminase family protein [Roseomonas sp.]